MIINGGLSVYKRDKRMVNILQTQNKKVEQIQYAYVVTEDWAGAFIFCTDIHLLQTKLVYSR